MPVAGLSGISQLVWGLIDQDLQEEEAFRRVPHDGVTREDCDYLVFAPRCHRACPQWTLYSFLPPPPGLSQKTGAHPLTPASLPFGPWLSVLHLAFPHIPGPQPGPGRLPTGGP